MRPPTVALFAVLAAATAPAQCAIQGLVAAPYGASCGAGASPQLFAQFWLPGCSVQLQLVPYLPSNAFWNGTWYVFTLSPQQAVVPIASFCPLPTNALAIAFSPVAFAGLTLPIPPGLGPFTFWIDSVTAYTSTISGQPPFFMPAQQGLQITLQ